MSDPERVRQLMRGVDALNRGDADAMLELVGETTVFEPLRSATEGAFIGRDGIRRFMADTAETFDLFKVSVTEVRELDDERLLVLGKIRMRGRGSGAESDVSTAALVEFASDGTIARFKDHGDERRALAEAARPS